MAQTDLSHLDVMIKNFLAASGDSELTSKIVLRQLSDAVRRRSAFLIYEVGSGSRCGYFFMEIQRSEYGAHVAVVSQLYLERKIDRSLIDRVDAVANDWAKDHGCEEAAFFTRRNPQAFLRRLGSGWKLDSYVLKRNVW